MTTDRAPGAAAKAGAGARTQPKSAKASAAAVDRTKTAAILFGVTMVYIWSTGPVMASLQKAQSRSSQAQTIAKAAASLAKKNTQTRRAVLQEQAKLQQRERRAQALTAQLNRQDAIVHTLQTGVATIEHAPTPRPTARGSQGPAISAPSLGRVPTVHTTTGASGTP